MHEPWRAFRLLMDSCEGGTMFSMSDIAACLDILGVRGSEMRMFYTEHILAFRRTVMDVSRSTEHKAGA